MRSKDVESRARKSIRAIRELRKMSRRELADLLTEQTGNRWSEAMVRGLETGKKRLLVNDLLAISRAQRAHWSYYLGRHPGDGFEDETA